MGKAVLSEPWSHPDVAAATEERRSGPKYSGRLWEYLASVGHAQTVAMALQESLPGLLNSLVQSRVRMLALGASDLSDTKFPPGAADDAFRCIVRSLRQNSPLRKVTRWLTA